MHVDVWGTLGHSGEVSAGWSMEYWMCHRLGFDAVGVEILFLISAIVCSGGLLCRCVEAQFETSVIPSPQRWLQRTKGCEVGWL